MYIWILYGILIAIAAVVAIIVLKMNVSAAIAKRKATATDKPRANKSDEECEEYANNLSRLIGIPTIADGKHDDDFAAFREELKRQFPLLHERAELTVMGSGCLIYKVSGKNAVKNVMIMSHHDVVEGTGDWKYPPFAGEIKDGVLWGRGTIDTKTPLFAEMSAVEELLKEGCEFEGINVFIGSSSNEEICGDGMPLAVEHFKKQGVRFDVVLDEGGAVISGMMPGVNRKSAMVAVHEKGRHTFVCTANTTDKGHLGLNAAKSNVIDRMSAFVCEVKSSKILKASFSEEVRDMFETHAPYMSYPYRLLFSNIGMLKGLLLKVLPMVSSQVGSMLGTTMYFTRIRGEEQTSQIQAKTVSATAFFRCVREETLEKEMAEFKRIADKHGIEITPEIKDYCRPFSHNQEQFKVLKEVLNQNYPDVIVSPFLLTAGTDARSFTDIADCILRFAPIDLSPEQFASVHNPNENIGVKNIGECVCFYKSYLKRLCRQ